MDSQNPKNSNYVFVIGSSTSWLNDVTALLLRNKIHPIVLGTETKSFYCTFITQNHSYDAALLTNSININGKRCAYLGYNPDSHSDVLKYNGFISVIKEKSAIFSIDDLYTDETSVEKCLESFVSHINNYDVIFCSNDTYMFLLISQALNLSNHTLVSFGNLSFKQYCTVPFYSITPDYFNIGRCAISTLLFYQNNPQITYSSVYIKSNFFHHTRKFDLKVPYNQEAIAQKPKYNFKTPSIQQLDSFNIALYACDKTDLKILSYISKNKTYEQISENMYLSVAAVKRRTSNIFSCAGFSSKKDFIVFCDKFKLDFSSHIYD